MHFPTDTGWVALPEAGTLGDTARTDCTRRVAWDAHEDDLVAAEICYRPGNARIDRKDTWVLWVWVHRGGPRVAPLWPRGHITWYEDYPDFSSCFARAKDLFDAAVDIRCAIRSTTA